MTTDTTTTRTTETPTVVRPARGGVSGGAILTGVVVAFGCMFLLSALVAGVLITFGVTLRVGGAVEASLVAGFALIVAQFVSYLWGGYTAGRMGRGAGLANGLLVPLVAVLVAILVGAVATALGATVNLNLPFQAFRVPVEENYLVNWGVGVGIASVAAMFLGGGIGGILGTRWHSRLEATATEEAAVVQPPQTRTTGA